MDAIYIFTVELQYVPLLWFMINVRNIHNLICWEEYEIGRIVLSASILHSLTKNNNIGMPGTKKKEVY